MHLRIEPTWMERPVFCSTANLSHHSRYAAIRSDPLR